MTGKRWKALVATLLGIGAIAGAQAQTAAADVFSRGRVHGIVTAGWGSAFNEDYLILGAGVNYFVLDGLSLGVNLETWRGANPTLTKLTPSAQYVFYQVRTIKPYVGAFYRRTWINGGNDLDSYGARVGAYLQAGRNAYLGLGGVYEKYKDCRESTYRSCDSTYPEASLTFAF
ncbi:MAG TPA: hypothetical protein VFJ70_19470 [Burkholderiales bacterium]|nr:hypothetical protein [Burkholderiales bacterium]